MVRGRPGPRALSRNRTRLFADSRNRSVFFADSTINTGFSGKMSAVEDTASRYCSMIKWAFAPPAPNELTPARRGRVWPPTGNGSQSSRRRCTRKKVSSNLMFGFSFSVCRDGTSFWYLSWSNTLVTPAMPAADSQCPIFDLTDPTAQNCRGGPPAIGRSLPWSKASVNACCNPVISIGSPSTVPVP